MKFREVDQTNWDDFVKLFEGKGCPSYCWCMAWRPLEGDRNKITNAGRKKSMKAIVKAGTPIGILAYEGKMPVAWCSISPRATHRALSGDEYAGVDEDEIWSLVCFFVPRAMRGQGVMTQLLDAAVKTARKTRRQDRRGISRRPGVAQLPLYGLRQEFQESWF